MRGRRIRRALDGLRSRARLRSAVPGNATGRTEADYVSNVANVRVAIRTAVFDHAGKSARYGTGSGIVWGSDALAERRECLDKTAVLDSDDGFYVFDSMLLENGGISDLDAHLARLRKSCRYFFLPESTHDGLENELLSLCRNTTDGSWKVRILCSANGTRKIECDPVPPLPAPYCVAPAPERGQSLLRAQNIAQRASRRCASRSADHVRRSVGRRCSGQLQRRIDGNDEGEHRAGNRRKKIHADPRFRNSAGSIQSRHP